MKKDIRKKIKNKLKDLTIKQIIDNSKIIEQTLNKTYEFKSAKKIGIYNSIDKEVITKKIIFKLLDEKKEVLLPKMENDKLIFLKTKSLKNLNKGPYGILEPFHANSLSIPDLIILPAIALDKNGNRIGRGKGYFDRYLNKNPHIKTICLIHDLQIIKKITPEKHDKKIDIVISEKQIIKTNQLLDGTKIAHEITNKLKKKIIKKKIKATLAVILVGNNASSKIYIKKKEEECKKIGIGFKLIKFSKDTKNYIVKNEIEKLNKDKIITGILIQLPLPKQLNTSMLLDTVKQSKDVDGLTSKSLTDLKKGNEFLPCCTPKGILTLLESSNIDLKNKKITLVGNGRLVGKPLAIMLKNRNLNFSVCDKKTKDLKSETIKADIIITATGVPNLIKKEYVKNGAILIDAGTNKIKGKIVGDSDFDQVSKITSKITPAIGGVGPMTIASLLENIVKAYEKQ